MRRPVVSYAIALLTLLSLPCASQAQSTDYAPFVPRLIASVGYSFIYANDPPGGAHKFDINGSFVSLDYNFRHWYGLTGEFTGGQARQISPIGQNLNLFTYTGGPRFAWRPPGRVSIFSQILVGRATGSHSYFPTATSYTTSSTVLAGSIGGGLSYRLTHRYSLRGDVRYLHTDFNNGVNTSQNQLMFNAGFSIKFGGHYVTPRPSPAKFPDAEPMPDPLPASPPMPVPAASQAPVPTTAEATPIAPAVPATPAPATEPIATPPGEPPAGIPPNAFHEDETHPPVGDIYFDYGKVDIGPQAEISLRQVTLYLQTHPGQRVLIAGYSDERGAMEHNLELGEQRATAIRDALVRKGVDASQVTVVTYGKGAEICLKPEDPCFQRNRRIAFLWLR